MSVRRFDAFLFENFDAEDAANHPLNPRRVMTEKADALLSMAAQGCIWDEAAAADATLLHQLEACGILRRDANRLAFDSPVFLREDAGALSGAFRADAAQLAALLEAQRPALWVLADRLGNGFPAPLNLYHIICGMVLDGDMFDDLCESGVVATGRAHSSGLDYIAVLYEKCAELDAFSNGLLCSWNRLTDGSMALQSFGDANGSRLDPYRYFRLKEAGRLTGRFAQIRVPDKAELFNAARSLIDDKGGDPTALNALEAFGYARGGRIHVPVYREEDRPVINEISQLVRSILVTSVSRVLTHCQLDITSVRHGVSPAETANELYHILFGLINEELVRCGMVAEPLHRPGEGRYWQSIQLF